MAIEAADRLAEILQAPDDRIDLALAALTLATLEYPELDIPRYEGVIDSHSEGLAPLVHGREDPDELAAAFGTYLAGVCGYGGNAEDYYDPRNSFLNDVLERRTGIPITLSVIYLAVARRLNLPLFGVGLPGHFIVKLADGGNVRFLDPFHGGRQLNKSGCEELARSATGHEVTLSEGDFAAATAQSIIVRMLHNLRGIYGHSLQHEKGLGVTDALIRITPENAHEYRNRACLRLQLGQAALAREDLETYLALRPDASDAEDVKKAIAGIRKSQAMMN